jgi:hypothetical protein
MQRIALLLFAGLLVMPALAEAQSQTEREVIETILANSRYTNQNLTTEPESLSKLGAVAFWSSGGMLQEVSREGSLGRFVSVNINPKHIQVITLVEGQAAVAMYYSEGTMHPEGADPVSNYRTRVTQAFVKEDGRWRLRASHWSALGPGSGTTQVVQ